ncbi:hypothetical protein [Salisediminibacterium halotolerans]|uniref:hypothetical protein n=1 Tax=Salisediminibacterium halotolerans TaxID=517425 RepID=UPI000B862A21|nr:hypothetical protein [Salisediminibacterium haloalkalitolerans]
MKRKSLRNSLIAIIAVTVLSASSYFSYSGYTTAKQECLANDGTITEHQLDIWTASWSVDCEQ